MPLTRRQEEILNNAHLSGMGDGVTVPINIPGEFAGSCSFCMRMGRDIPLSSLPTAQYLGCFAFQAARRLVEKQITVKPAIEEAQQRLSPRQLDCVILAGRGKSDRDVGQLLGISGQTVHQHMEEAKRRFNVATRQQLIVRALFDSQITFADLMN
jgi:LuxR family quorum-sensing system transcriptional regulator CciR